MVAVVARDWAIEIGFGLGFAAFHRLRKLDVFDTQNLPSVRGVQNTRTRHPLLSKVLLGTQSKHLRKPALIGLLLLRLLSLLLKGRNTQVNHKGSVGEVSYSEGGFNFHVTA